MKIDNVKKRCAICGKEDRYEVVYSYSSLNLPDFDLKPVGSHLSIGGNVQECPYCHYCNYNIEEAIEKRYQKSYKENVKLWKSNKFIQEVIENESGDLRKFLILSRQYENNLDYENCYRSLLKASWVCEDENKANDLRMQAIRIYIENILPNRRSEIMQVADLLRMSSEFEIANEFLNASESVLNEAESNFMFLQEMIKKEREYIIKEDSARHNLSEIE